MVDESPPASPEPQQRTGGGGGSGCGCLLVFLLVFVVIPYWKGKSFSQIWDRLKILAEFVWWIVDNVGRLLLAYGATALLIYALFRVIKAIEDRKEGNKQAIDYLARFLPVKTLFTVGRFFADSRQTLRQVLSGETIWFGPLFALVLTVAALDGLESLLGLPPTKASAAGVIYSASVEQALAEEEPNLLWAAPRELLKNATPAQLETAKRRITHNMWRYVQEQWASDTGSPREVMRETIKPGLSTLAIYLESIYGIRTSKDLLAALPEDLAGRERLKKAANEIEQSSKWQQAIEDGTLAMLVIPYAFFLWMGSRRAHSFLRTVGVSSILWTTTLVVSTLVYIASALVHMLWVAHILATLAQFITWQIWILAVLPDAAGISRLRSWLLGTVTFVVTELGSFVLILWIFRG